MAELLTFVFLMFVFWVKDGIAFPEYVEFQKVQVLEFIPTAVVLLH